MTTGRHVQCANPVTKVNRRLDLLDSSRQAGRGGKHSAEIPFRSTHCALALPSQTVVAWCDAAALSQDSARNVGHILSVLRLSEVGAIHRPADATGPRAREHAPYRETTASIAQIVSGLAKRLRPT